MVVLQAKISRLGTAWSPFASPPPKGMIKKGYTENEKRMKRGLAKKSIQKWRKKSTNPEGMVHLRP
jgi:hypothetical protein